MIEIRDCTKRYGELLAVDNLSLTVQERRIFGFLGPNGAGKSTLIKMIVGMISPDAGTIRIGGYDIGQDPVKAKSIIAFVPEKGYAYEKLTAWEYLTFIRGLYGLETADFEKQASEYLAIFGLMQWRNHLIGDFSMGMKQRLLLSSAFMRKPGVIILDEPHNGLDPKGVRLLKDVVFACKNEGATVILSTHIIAIAEQICDEIVIMNKGSVVAQGSNEDLRRYAKSSDKNLEDIFLRLTADYEAPAQT